MSCVTKAVVDRAVAGAVRGGVAQLPFVVRPPVLHALGLCGLRVRRRDGGRAGRVLGVRHATDRRKSARLERLVAERTSQLVIAREQAEAANVG